MFDKPYAFLNLLFFCILSQSLPSAAAAPAVSLGPDLAVREAIPGIYVVTHTFPWASNSLVAVMGDRDLLLIDTPCTPEATNRLLDWASREFPSRPLTAINTHYHLDRLGGNAALLDRRIPIYGSQMTARFLAERGETSRKQMLGWVSDPAIREVYRTLAFLPPDHLFPEREGLILPVGGEKVELFYPGPGHTPDNIVAYIPSKQVLFGGCFAIGQERLGNLTEADIPAWLDSLQKLKRFKTQLVVPGHGHESPDLLPHTERLLKAALP